MSTDLTTGGRPATLEEAEAYIARLKAKPEPYGPTEERQGWLVSWCVGVDMSYSLGNAQLANPNGLWAPTEQGAKNILLRLQCMAEVAGEEMPKDGETVWVRTLTAGSNGRIDKHAFDSRLNTFRTVWVQGLLRRTKEDAERAFEVYGAAWGLK